MRVRVATPADALALATIYNQGIEDRVATFETRLRTPEEVTSWFDGVHPVVVVEQEGGVIAFASTSTYRARECYAGIAEFSVYVHRAFRGQGAGRLALQELFAGSRASGVLETALAHFRGEYRQLGPGAITWLPRGGDLPKPCPLDGVWRDVMIVEKLLTVSHPFAQEAR